MSVERMLQELRRKRDEAEQVRDAAPILLAEMLRYLPALERAEADPALWAQLTDGLGIATLNGYRAALKSAQGAA